MLFPMPQVAPSVRMAQGALDAHASEDGLFDEPLSAALCHLLPPLVYQGKYFSSFRKGQALGLVGQGTGIRSCRSFIKQRLTSRSVIGSAQTDMCAGSVSELPASARRCTGLRRERQ